MCLLEKKSNRTEGDKIRSKSIPDMLIFSLLGSLSFQELSTKLQLYNTYTFKFVYDHIDVFYKLYFCLFLNFNTVLRLIFIICA